MEEPVLDPSHLYDVHTLFATYSRQYFESQLDGCLLEWSNRMTLAAGLCYLKGNGRGGRHCIIRLSRPLLQYRPFSDTINTLLHEMIHAYLFLKDGYLQLDRDGHGSDFQALMHRINREAGSTITIYHTFHAEVNEQRKHHWRCTGPCKDKPPFYGWCRRSMNRPPQPADWWFSNHKRTCGGTYIKVSGPESPAKQAKSTGTAVVKKKAQPVNNLDNYFGKLKGTGKRLGGDPAVEPKKGSNVFIAGSAFCSIIDESEPDDELPPAPVAIFSSPQKGPFFSVDLTEDT